MVKVLVVVVDVEKEKRVKYVEMFDVVKVRIEVLN